MKNILNLGNTAEYSGDIANCSVPKYSFEKIVTKKTRNEHEFELREIKNLKKNVENIGWK